MYSWNFPNKNINSIQMYTQCSLVQLLYPFSQSKVYFYAFIHVFTQSSELMVAKEVCAKQQSPLGQQKFNLSTVMSVVCSHCVKLRCVLFRV